MHWNSVFSLVVVQKLLCLDTIKCKANMCAKVRKVSGSCKKCFFNQTMHHILLSDWCANQGNCCFSLWIINVAQLVFTGNICNTFMEAAVVFVLNLILDLLWTAPLFTQQVCMFDLADFSYNRCKSPKVFMCLLWTGPICKPLHYGALVCGSYCKYSQIKENTTHIPKTYIHLVHEMY